MAGAFRFRPRRAIVLLLLTLLGLVVAGIVWAFWPLIVFFQGQPVLHRVADLRLTNHGAAPIAILGGTLIDGNGGAPVENSAIVLRDQRIVEVGRAADVRIPPDAVRIQASGKTVLPGLIDMHVHLFKGDDLHLFIAAGVTTVRDVGGFTDQMVRLADGTRSGELLGPRVFFSGESFIHESGFAQWQRPTKNPDEARVEVKKRIASGASVIKIVSDITPDLVQAIVEEAHRANVPVTADILGNGVVTAERAIRLGVDGLEHVSGVPQSIQADDAPTHFSEPVSNKAMLAWMYADKQKEQALIQLMIERGTYVVPTFSVMQMLFPEGVPVPDDPAVRYVSERLRAFWTGVDRIPSLSSATDRALEDAFLVHFAYSQPFVRRLDAAGGRIVAGTDEPTPGLVPGFSLHREMELLVEAGLTPMRAIQAATKTAAQFLGKSNELGTIEVGKLADLIVVDGQPHVRIGDIRQVRTVLKNGIPIDASDVLKLSARK
jgi:imidazolonepropionase-like amidohydrolase